MYHEFSEILGELGLWNGEGKILLAVSGGIDSMCMADLFRRTGLPFSVAHCNFHLRGEESDADEALVAQWAESSGAGFHKADFDTEAFASGRGVSIEMAARELRYGWFSRLCSDYGYAAVCVAHNANDNAETLFLNIVRGTGLRGLSGMSPESVLPYSGGTPARLLRPMLSFTRKQIEGYVMSHSVSFREDRTNASDDYRRNRIRHQVFPVLEMMNPSFIKTVSAEMRRFAQAGAVADSYAASVIGRVTSEDKGCVSADLGALMSSDSWEYVLYCLLDRYGFNGTVADSLVSLLKSGRTLSGKRFHSTEFTLLTTGTSLIIRPVSSRDLLPDDFTARMNDGGFTVVRGEGAYLCNGVSFSVSVADRSSVPSLKQPEGTLLFDAAVLRFPFVCRKWKDGDWFVPFGMRGRKKVSDFFTDLKYDMFRKEEAVMIVDASDKSRDDKRIAAVLGERIDDRYRVTPSTTSVIIVKKA